MGDAITIRINSQSGRFGEKYPYGADQMPRINNRKTEMKSFLFRSAILPEGFKFPPGYKDLAQSGNWPDLALWFFLASDMPLSLSLYAGMLLKFPKKPLVPFARTYDPAGFYNDGYVVLACFDGADTLGQPRVRIYDFGRPKNSPWDNLSCANFEEWISAAKKESASYKAQQAEFEEHM